MIGRVSTSTSATLTATMLKIQQLMPDSEAPNPVSGKSHSKETLWARPVWTVYSRIICISSESCLWSIVGFARLPCFGTLRSVISAKVALGELLRLCPGSAGLSTSVEKAKTDCHDKARAGRCSRGFLVPKDLCRLERGVGFVRPRRV